MKEQIVYMVICIHEYAAYKSITPDEAFLYLYENKGIDFLSEHYEAEHTLSLEDAIEDLDIICRRNGGNL